MRVRFRRPLVIGVAGLAIQVARAVRRPVLLPPGGGVMGGVAALPSQSDAINPGLTSGPGVCNSPRCSR